MTRLYVNFVDIIFSDILLQAQASQDYGILTDDYLRAEVDMFMFEGYDTTSNAYLLARYPGVQRKAWLELDLIFGGDPGTLKLRFSGLCQR